MAEGLQSVILTMQIVEHVARTGKGVGVTSLATALGTSKSRIHRHLQTLVQQGYVFQHEDSERYEIGHQLVSLGQAVLDNSGLVGASRDSLLALRDRIGRSAVASQLTPEGMLVIATVRGPSPIEIGVRVGSLLSFNGSAQGKVAAAFSSEAFQQRVLTGELTAYTEHTITDPEQLAAEFAEIRARGWATAPNQAALGLNTLASPILDASGAACGTVGIVDLAQSLDAEPDPEHIAAVLDTARRISVLMGHSGALPFG
ncbi:IclR family transcriptional regulator [Salipiger abyssi]|uniref:IclR family transcriptional regulator n=1 Tax=Salipiger abyssi TaxID=1250539 RepID=UPI001A8D9007|nr:IclR family transcriptional regulator [Salipiger abyssi]MBN9888907.1 IclR family transcriptional regulator [Salipiger abyssi]